MSPRPITLLLDDEPAADGWLQPLAGGELWSRQPIGSGATRAPRPDRWSGELSPIGAEAGAPAAGWSVVYDGPGLVDGALKTVRSSLSPRGARRVDFDDGESFIVEASGDVVRRLARGVADARSLERALGAPLALALALRGRHLLHASAVARRAEPGGPHALSGAIAFTATSGAGKSTLAAAALRQPPAEPGALVRIADDQLPVNLELPVRALPHFPQLKLRDPANYPASAPRELPLECLVEIGHSPELRALEIERLSPSEACLALARATVAAKLFDPALLSSHFDLCAAAGAVLPVYRLRYPSGLDRLPEVLAAVAANTAAHGTGISTRK